MSGTVYLHKVILKNFDDPSYLADLPVVQNLQRMGELAFDSPVTFFCRRKWFGKINIAGGHRYFSRIQRGRRFPELFICHEIDRVKSAFIYHPVTQGTGKGWIFYRAESFYNVASQVVNLQLNLDGYGGKSLHDQLHGESLMALVQNRFRGNGLYILDEPEAALSPLRQMTLMLEIKRLVEEEHSQFLIATHSPILITYPDADIFEVTADSIKKNNIR